MRITPPSSPAAAATTGSPVSTMAVSIAAEASLGVSSTTLTCALRSARLSAFSPSSLSLQQLPTVNVQLWGGFEVGESALCDSGWRLQRGGESLAEFFCFWLELSSPATRAKREKRVCEW